MQTHKERRVVVGADSAGFQLKQAVAAHLRMNGWTVDDLTPDPEHTPLFHHVGFQLGAEITEGHHHKALAFDGGGAGIHIAASKVPHVHATVAESVEAARRSAAGNGANLLAIGAFFVGPELACAMADAFLEAELGDGYENWEGFAQFHGAARDEVEAFDYASYRAAGFTSDESAFPPLGPRPIGVVL